MRGKRTEQLVALLVLLAFFALAAWDATDFRGQARTFPLTIALVMVALVGLEFIVSLRRRAPKASAEPTPDASIGETGSGEPTRTMSAQLRRILPYILWLLGLYLSIYLVGMVLACALFVFLFVWQVGKVPWYWALAAGLGAGLFLILLTNVMNLRWPRSLSEPLEWLGISL